MLIPSFASPLLRDLCEHQELAEESLGLFVAKHLHASFSDLVACASLAEHPLFADSKELDGSSREFTIPLGGGGTLEIALDHVKSQASVAYLDVRDVNRFKVIKIEVNDGQHTSVFT